MDAHSALQTDPNADNLFAYIANTNLSGREILALTGGLAATIPHTLPTLFGLHTPAPSQADTPTSAVTGPVVPATTSITTSFISAACPQPTLYTSTKRKRHTLVNPGNPLDPRTRICQPPGSPRTEKRRCENARAVRRWRVRKAAKDAGDEMERQFIRGLRAERGEMEEYQPFLPPQLHPVEKSTAGYCYSAE